MNEADEQDFNDVTAEHDKDAWIKCVKDMQKLKAENKLLKECVEFYADENNWQDCWIDGCAGSEDYFTNIITDMGSRVGGYKARETLAKIKGNENV